MDPLQQLAIGEHLYTQRTVRDFLGFDVCETVSNDALFPYGP
jgi:hypothetical protein